MNLIYKKKSSILYLFISFFFLGLVIYKDQIIFNGSKYDHYKYYYSLSFLLIIFSLFSFKVKKIEILNLVSVSIVLSFYFLELMLIYILDYSFKKQNEYKEKAYFSKTGKLYDSRTTLQIYESLAKEKKIKLFIPPYKFFQNRFTPLSGISDSQTLFCNENGSYIFYNSDRYGFNNLDQNWDMPKIEFFIIGDSFAQGACVDQQKNISGSLINIIKKRNGVLNIGASGNGLLANYAAMKEYSKKINIKNMIWLFYDNDIQNLSEREKNSATLLKYFQNDNYSQNLTSRQPEINKAIERYINKNLKNKKKKIKKNTKIFDFLKLKRLRYLVHVIFLERKYEEEDYIFFEKILKKAYKYANKNNINFYFVYLPDYQKFKSFYKKDYVYKKITKIVKNNNIILIDMYDEFRKKKDPLSLFPFKLYGHYTEEGYMYIAKAIYEKSFKQKN